MSRAAVPDGFAQFAGVIVRLGEYRVCGQGVTFRCLFPDRHRHGDRRWSGRAFISREGDLMAQCMGCGADRFTIMKEIGLPFRDWKNPTRRSGASGRAASEYPLGNAPPPKRRTLVSNPVAVYDYRDARGELVYQKLRYEPKRFVQRRPLSRAHFGALGIPDAAEPWVWGLGAGRYGRSGRDGDFDLYYVDPARHQFSVELPVCRRVLYHLPDVLAAAPQQPVFLVEGEKDVETLRAFGFVATCGPCGSAQADGEWLAALAMRRVVAVADNDSAGRAHAVENVGWLAVVGARSARVVWPGAHGYDVEPGGDISDWLGAREHPRECLIEMVKKFPEYRMW
jgi:hypothetical protein